jgi:hypothetical protein
VACSPGQSCPPATCSCGGGGGPSGGCVSGGTCTCSCPACRPGESCPPCACACGSGGAVSPAGPIGMASGGGMPGGGGSPGTDMGGPTPPPDPCSAHHDQPSCAADTADQCHWYAVPCSPNAPNCPSGVCERMSPVGGGCACSCAACTPGQQCPPCTCGCDPNGGCVPPPLPPSGGSMACPLIGCAQQCPNGYTKDARGCPTCTCA